MASVGYPFSIQNDTPNHCVDIDRLTLEIRDSAITTAFDYAIAGTPTLDTLTAWFKDNLNQDNLDILHAVVHAHSGAPLPKGVPMPVDLKCVDLNLPVTQKGFPDYSGYPFFVDGVWGDCAAGTPEAPQTSYLYLSFNKVVRIQGGCVETDQANKGDYFRLELTYGIGGPVVGQFVVKKGVSPGKTIWERTLPDSQPIPVGIYLRMAYVNVGPNSVYVISSYDLRRTPA